MLLSLLLACTVLTVGMVVLGSLTSHLNLASQFRRRTQGELWARAALSEFLLRAQEQQSKALPLETPPPVLDAFRQDSGPLFQSRDGSVSVDLLLGTHDSIDNSLGAQPRSSRFDLAGSQSVPPFSVDLLLRVRGDGPDQLYEAALQHLWPYVLAVHGPLVVAGQIDLPAKVW